MKMAATVLDAVVGDIVERVVSAAVDEIGLVIGVDGEVKKLKAVLTSIQAVLHDAERKQVEQQVVKVWLHDLKKVAYDAEDVLDKIAYKELKYTVHNKVPRWLNPKRYAARGMLAHEIKAINEELNAICERKQTFQLEQSNYRRRLSSSRQMITYHQETASYVKESTVIGRWSDKEEIIKMLINAHVNIALPVIAIVGLGGLGKTALAQLVYNNDTVKKHFEFKVWICVSNFETKNLFFQILDQINPKNTRRESSSKQVLLDELKSQLQKLGTKKFLLVLDDDWNEDPKKWEDFALPLGDFVAPGSRIIVTSRDSNVASIRGAQTVHVHRLQGLSEDSCWDIIKSQAFKKGEREKASVVEIGKQISNKCKGVPLAAKVLGGLLQSKKEDWEWKAVRDAEFWNLPSDGTKQILEVLKFSYYNLPSSTLKSCFSYCAIFPKDYRISKALLIELWMAQGLLGAGEVMEDKGNTYFNILYSKSFFQEAEMNEYGEVIRCKMHGLMNDLAQSICKFECQNVGESMKTSVDLSECRHASFISSMTVGTLCKATKVRTIFGWESNYEEKELDDGGTAGVTKISTFFTFKLLRVLDLSGFRGSDFSSLFGKLKHLRYLDLSSTSIKSLPKWVTRLYHLQTLKLINCDELKKLPKDLMNLKKLRHLFIDNGKKWKKMPQALGKLDELQTLPIFMACQKNGILVLENLKHLRGTLEIRHLCLVKEASLAKGAKLIDKENLRELSFNWDSDDSHSCVGGDCDDLQVLKELQPHPNLKELSIEGFRGVEFPGWVLNGSLLSHLVAIKISDCNHCEHISSFGELPQLERLEMMNMSKLKHIGGRGASQSSYPRLKELIVSSLPNLQEWSGNAASILFPSLKSLILDNVGGMGVVSITSSITSLTSLSITCCRDLELHPEGLLRNNNQLDVVRINSKLFKKSITNK